MLLNWLNKGNSILFQLLSVSPYCVFKWFPKVTRKAKGEHETLLARARPRLWTLQKIEEFQKVDVQHTVDKLTESSFSLKVSFIASSLACTQRDFTSVMFICSQTRHKGAFAIRTGEKCWGPGSAPSHWSRSELCVFKHPFLAHMWGVSFLKSGTSSTAIQTSLNRVPLHSKWSLAWEEGPWLTGGRAKGAGSSTVSLSSAPRPRVQAEPRAARRDSPVRG